MRDAILEHLRALVAHDTRNPPRAIGTGGIFDTLRAALPGFRCTVTDHGAGAVSLWAVRGRPNRLYNFHLDTVPASEGWSRDPFVLHVADGRATGLGACDIKGAAAAMLAAAARTTGDLALLFSSDEEANDPRCIAAFLAGEHGCVEAIVAEPTRARAVAAHRGIVSARLAFAGSAGHASEARALADSAVHKAVRWSAAALTWAQSFAQGGFGGLAGMPFNIGRIEGGIKGNVIAPTCELRVGFRPLPGQDVDALLGLFRGLAAPSELAAFEVLFRGPTLPAGGGDRAAARLAAAEALATRLGLPLAPPVNFWTEASLFSEAGLTALVYGPGDIAQAHTADEWVAIDELETVADTYVRLIDGAP